MSLENSILVAVWVYARIQSPFLILCSYGLIKRMDKLASPFVVVPAITGVCALFYLAPPSRADFPLMFPHLIFAAFFILGGYFVCLKLSYSRPDALVLSLLCFVAIDELWQTPWNFQLWTKSLRYFEVGITTGAWNLMSLPIIGYLLLKINHNIMMDSMGRFALVASLGLTFLASVALQDPLAPISPFDYNYVLVLPWFFFFMSLFHSSRASSSISNSIVSVP